MSCFEIVLLGIGLSMDAFAVAVCKGLAMKKATLAHSAIVGGWFGFFQGFMPFLGYLLAFSFSKYINAFDHWIAFILLCVIGVNMIKESCSCEESESLGDSLAFKVMLLMAIATSIDSLAVGVSFGFMISFGKMLVAVLIIAFTTFIISAIGVKIGNIFGTKFKSKAELAGGVILILIGLKILLEGIGVLAF